MEKPDAIRLKQFFIFSPKLFAWQSVTFILFTVIGTLSHEGGHWLVARLNGVYARINYGQMIFVPAYQDALTPKVDLIIRAGGPLQTMLTGTIGFLLILFWMNDFLTSSALNLRQWLLIFLSLFWLRQACNFFVFLADWFIQGSPRLRADEILLEAYLQWPPLSIMGSSAAIAMVVALIVIFRVIPFGQRFTFIVSGLVGGSLDYYLWLLLIGPIIMP